MLVETRTIAIRARALVRMHRENSISKLGLSKRCREYIIVVNRDRQINNIYDRRKIAILLLKNIHKIVPRYFLQALFPSNLITYIIIKRGYTVYLFPSCCRCMENFCVSVAILLPVSFSTLTPIGIVLGQQSLHALSKSSYAKLVLPRSLQPCVLHLSTTFLNICF